MCASVVQLLCEEGGGGRAEEEGVEDMGGSS